MKFNFTVAEFDPFHHATEARDFEELKQAFETHYPTNYFEAKDNLRQALIETAKANGLLVVTGEYLENRFFACLHSNAKTQHTRVSRFSETHALMSCLVDYAEQNAIKMLPENDDFKSFPDWLGEVKALWSKDFGMSPDQYLGDWEADFLSDYQAEHTPQQAFDLFLQVQTQ